MDLEVPMVLSLWLKRMRFLWMVAWREQKREREREIDK